MIVLMRDEICGGAALCVYMTSFCGTVMCTFEMENAASIVCPCNEHLCLADRGVRCMGARKQPVVEVCVWNDIKVSEG